MNNQAQFQNFTTDQLVTKHNALARMAIEAFDSQIVTNLRTALAELREELNRRSVPSKQLFSL